MWPADKRICTNAIFFVFHPHITRFDLPNIGQFQMQHLLVEQLRHASIHLPDAICSLRQHNKWFLTDGVKRAAAKQGRKSGI